MPQGAGVQSSLSGWLLSSQEQALRRQPAKEGKEEEEGQAEISGKGGKREGMILRHHTLIFKQ